MNCDKMKEKEEERFMKNLTLMDLVVLFFLSYFFTMPALVLTLLAWRSLAKFQSIVKERHWEFEMFCVYSTAIILFLVHLG